MGHVHGKLWVGPTTDAPPLIDGMNWIVTDTGDVRRCDGTAFANVFNAIQYATPTTGQTVTSTPGQRNLTIIINPAGTLAALTVGLPAGPRSGDIVTIATSQIITALTLSGGTLVGAVTTLAVGGFATYMYHATAAKWFRIG